MGLFNLAKALIYSSDEQKDTGDSHDEINNVTENNHKDDEQSENTMNADASMKIADEKMEDDIESVSGRKIIYDNTNIIQQPIKETYETQLDPAHDLAHMIGQTLEQWTQKHNLESMPKDIIMDQVIAILQTVRKRF